MAADMLAVLRDLPDGSVISADDGTIAQRRCGAWLLPGDLRHFPTEAMTNRRGLTVLRVGQTAPAQPVTTERAT